MQDLQAKYDDSVVFKLRNMNFTVKYKFKVVDLKLSPNAMNIIRELKLINHFIF